MNMTIFRGMVKVAALAGILAGLLLTLIQQIQIIPLIHEAERYEHPESTVDHANHNHATGHEHGEWQPENGWQRTLSTTGANIVVALGFALLLSAAVAFRGAKLNWRTGLLWGLGGYTVFFVAPSLALPPEVPGAQAAELEYRQLWWISTSLFTASGLVCILFFRQLAVRILGALLLIVPHLIGAPQPEVSGSSAPEELAQAFVVATFIANAVFWLGLGGLFGFFHRRFAD
ncbi:MAG: CbtA family protein [Gammaproteobacteria bacterium]|nr:CbtA family protein [Gammaproteobacteria bacterium]